jgi:murein DD-endopeptidase MepM/ murein hydrolase activator NlpD
MSLLALAAPAAASTGGTAVPDTASGGVAYGQAIRKVLPRPVVRRFAIHGRAAFVRVDRKGTRRIRVSIALRRGHATRSLSRRIRTGRSVKLPLPALPPGRWTVSLHVRGLAREARAGLVIHGRHKPKPKPKPVPAPPPPPPAPTTAGGVFPVAGPHTYGDGIGAPRNGHTHQGQDVLAAEGTPVVAPLAGTILYRDYQAHSAGFYLVEHAVDGRDFFFAHCQKDTFTVPAGAAVSAGQQLCRVGHTGDARGPHLHFEIWVGGWRVDAGSAFIDPLPDLRAWDR